MQAIRGILFGGDPVASDDVRLSLSTYDSWLSGEFLTKVMVREFRGKREVLEDVGVQMDFIGADFVTQINPAASLGSNDVPGFRKDGYIHAMPVHVSGNHWVLMAVSIGERKMIEIWDSSFDPEKTDLFLAKYFSEISKLQWWFDEGHYPTRGQGKWEVVFRDSERQDNNYDCGVWVYKNFLNLIKRELDNAGDEEDIPVRVEDLSPVEIRRKWRLEFRALMPLYACVFGGKEIPRVLD
jgi:hypothetical protein